MTILEEMYDSVLACNIEEAVNGVGKALAQGLDPSDILNKGLIRAMTEVGRRFEKGECFVPEMLIAARVMQECVAILKPKLLEADVKPVGKVVIGTVKGDLHDIGKNLVSMMLEGVGFEIIDLGTDVAPEDFVAAFEENEAGIVAMSALLTTTMPAMKSAIDAFVDAGIRDQVKIMVGGAPVTQDYADAIGADIYALDAAAAARKAKETLAV